MQRIAAHKKKHTADSGSHDFWKLINFGAQDSDSDEDRLKKAILSLIACGIAFLALFWGCLYVISGYPASGAIPLTYAVVSFLSISHFFITKHFSFFRSSQFMMILLLPFFLMWSLGGFANGSAVMIWAFFTPLAALFFANLKSARRWLIAFMVLTIISALVDNQVSELIKPMPATLNTVYFLMNMGCGFLLVYVVLHYFVKDQQHSRRAALIAKEEALKARMEAEKAYEQIRQNEQKIMELMLTDPLTNIANRRCLHEQLGTEMDRASRYRTRLGIIMTDLDFFKRINDSYGHSAGDQVLIRYARIMQENIRSSDTVARYGGEEFVIIAPEINIEGIAALAERIRQTLEQTSVNGIEQSLSASFGITMMHDDDTQETILSRVDRALYESKHLGRNRITVIE